MKNILHSVIILFLASTVFYHCNGEKEENQPPDIMWGTDACEECRMIINETRFATAYITDDGQTRRFDDIICMARNLKKRHKDIRIQWFRDYRTDRWIPGKETTIVQRDSIITPMASGLVAIGNFSESGHREDHGGRIIQPDSLMHLTF